jgi:hypothetical protein
MNGRVTIAIPKTPPRSGLCECGCGRKTGLAGQTRNDRGDIKGRPVRFAAGHHSRIKSPVEYVVAESGCWEWQRARDPNGYGRMNEGGRARLAHRIYYERHVSAIPAGLELDHLCQNPGCVNPDHLEPVTPAVNVQRSRNAKLTPDQVREIRALAGELTWAELGERYGVGSTAIWKVLARKSWRNVA